MPQPRQFGAPMGAPQPMNQGRQQPKPASDAQVSDYMKAMIAADKQYHAKKAQAAPAQGQSGGLANTLGKPGGPGIGGKMRAGAIDTAVKDAGG